MGTGLDLGGLDMDLFGSNSPRAGGVYSHQPPSSLPIPSVAYRTVAC